MSALPQLAVASCTNGMTPDEQEFWDRAFIAAMPTALTVQGWRIGERAITSGADRMELAARWADYAVSERRERS